MTAARELVGAANRLGLNASQFSPCESTRAASVASAAHDTFVVGRPRVWWLGFQPPCETVPYGSPEEWAERLKRAIPEGTSHCWLIAESDGDTYPVFEVDVASLAALLGECSFFEYYLVDPKLGWIVADTDHNQFLIARPRAGR